MRTLSDTLKAAQEAVSGTPYIRIVLNTVDYSSRLLQLEHREEAYREEATIILNNSDLALSDVDMRGNEFEIGYGYVASGNEYSNSATLWVKSQQLVSLEGQLVCILTCEGQWTKLRELKAMIASDPPYYNVQYTTSTVYDLLELILETTVSWTLSALAEDDSIMDTFTPVLDINQMPFENLAAIIYRLMQMTKSYIRPRASKTWEVKYPQAADAVDETYYSDQSHYFFEYVEKSNILVPNKVGVFANQGDDGLWTNIITGEAEDADAIADYGEVYMPVIAATITSQGDADNRAAAILARLKAEQLAGRLIVPHDCRVELYDRVKINDARGL